MQLAGITWRMARSVIGVLLTTLGAVLLLDTTAAIGVILVLLCAGLVLTGAARLLDAVRATRWRVVHVVAALLLLGAGIMLALWHSASLPVLALATSLALLTGGVLRLAAVFTGRTHARWRGTLSAATGLFAAILVIFWPRLSLWVLGVVFGAWLVLHGLSTLYQAWADRIVVIPRWLGRLGRVGGGLLTVAGLVLVLALGAVTALLHATGGRAVPDEFYLPPAALPAEPGQLLRAEPLERNLPEGSRAWRILYTTTDKDGGPALSSGVVTVPLQAAGRLPVLSWANGTKGVQSRCALSMAENPYDDGPAVARRQMLDAGWAVVATDYPGLGTAGPHPYLVPRAEAAAVLDATRAAGQLPDVQLADTTVLWGHSQGGHAALAAAALAGDYAPEFTVLGVAAMAPANNLAGLAESVKDTAAGKVVGSYIAESWEELYPQLGLGNRLDGTARRAVERIAGNCFTGTDVLRALAEASQLFEPIFPAAALHGAVGDQLRANSAPTRLHVPVFLSQGAADSLVTPRMQEGWRQAACAAGSPVYYRQYPALEHMGLVGAGSPLNADLVQWSTRLLEGSALPGSCT